MRVVIIGGNAAGMSAAARLQRKQKDVQITVYEQTMEVSYGACGLPYYIAGENSDLGLMRIRTAQQFLEHGIDLRLRHTVTAVDPASHTVSVRDGQTGRCFDDRYDKLVIASGAAPVVPPWPGVELQGVHTVKTLADAHRLRQALEARPEMAVAIIGGGYIGVEVAEACLRQNARVHLFEALPQMLGVFDEEFAAAAAERLRAHGAAVHLGEKVLELRGENQAVRQIVTTGGHFQAELVVVSVGVRPNTAFLPDCFAKAKNGALLVDERMCTNQPDIYAGGDCATVLHKLSDQPVYLPLGTNANKQGRLIADAISGKPVAFRTLGTAMLRCVDLELARTGLSARQARELNYNVKTVTVQTRSHARYYPDPAMLTIKLCYEAGSRRILGAQLMGAKEAAWRIDVFAVAINQKMTTGELGLLDLGYAPPFASVWDAVQIAANAAK